jgi:hypothetical protein
MVEKLKLGVYQHYKGPEYRVLNLVKHSETEETLVYYECLYPNASGQFWVRPLAMFQESVEIDGKTIPRFKFIRD